MEPIVPVQMNIYQINTNRKDLSWRHFQNKPRIQERQQMKDQQSCILVFVAYPTIPSSNQEQNPTHDYCITCIAVWQIYSKLRRKKLYRTNKGSNFFGDSSKNRSNVSAPIQFRRESQLQHLKRLFFLKNRSIHFHINSPSAIRPVKQNQLSSSSIEINKPLPAPIHSVPQIKFKFRS